MGKQTPWTVWRLQNDEKLCERVGLTPWDLIRLRKAMWTAWRKTSRTSWRILSEGGTAPRFGWLELLIVKVWSIDLWERWLRHLEHSERDLTEMAQGNYPISPYIIRNYSALFGIMVEFLLLGAPPVIDKIGANIELWPATGDGYRRTK
jgi:hypothetical protein